MERECTAAALAGLQLCPRHHLPCWVCMALEDLQRTVTGVTGGVLAARWPVDEWLAQDGRVKCRHCFETASAYYFHLGFL